MEREEKESVAQHARRLNNTHKLSLSHTDLPSSNVLAMPLKIIQTIRYFYFPPTRADKEENAGVDLIKLLRSRVTTLLQNKAF